MISYTPISVKYIEVPNPTPMFIHDHTYQEFQTEPPPLSTPMNYDSTGDYWTGKVRSPRHPPNLDTP